LEEGAFIIYTFSNHPPRRLRTALLMAQHPEQVSAALSPLWYSRMAPQKPTLAT